METMKTMKRKIFYAENTDVYPGIIARNKAVVEYEKFLHRTYYPYVIHPYSTFRVTVELISIVLIPFRLFFISFLWAALPHEDLAFQLPVLIFQILNFMDVVLNFFTGYVDSELEVAVLEPRRIVKRYLSTHFVIDFLPCIPLELIYIFAFTPKDNNTADIILDVLSHFLYLRYFAFLRYVTNLSKIMLWNVFLVGLISVCLGTCFVLLIASNIYHITRVHKMLKRARNHNNLRLFPLFSSVALNDIMTYVDELFFLIFDCLFFDSKVPTSYVYIRSIVLICTFMSNIIFMAFFIRYAILKMTPKEKFLDLESRVLTFVRIKHLPRMLESKILLYFQIMLENKAGGEDEIFDYIPDTFKADIFFQLCLPLLKHYAAFEDLPTYILRSLAECMKYQLYLPNEVVVPRDETKVRMYFVHRGTIALYSSNHVELYHFEGGNSFNGRQLILGEPTMGSYAISLEVSEVYRLDREDFVEIMKAYPNLYGILKQRAVHDKTMSPYYGS